MLEFSVNRVLLWGNSTTSHRPRPKRLWPAAISAKWKESLAHLSGVPHPPDPSTSATRTRRLQTHYLIHRVSLGVCGSGLASWRGRCSPRYQCPNTTNFYWTAECASPLGRQLLSMAQSSASSLLPSTCGLFVCIRACRAGSAHRGQGWEAHHGHSHLMWPHSHILLPGWLGHRVWLCAQEEEGVDLGHPGAMFL